MPNVPNSFFTSGDFVALREGGFREVESFYHRWRSEQIDTAISSDDASALRALQSLRGVQDFLQALEDTIFV